MSRTTRHRCRTVLALAVSAIAALPALAGAANVTVRVEGQSETLLAPTVVAIGARGSPARAFRREQEREVQRCDADTAYQAVELAVRGDWDRQLFAVTVMREAHRFEPNEEYWIPYDRNVTSSEWHYDEWGLCNLHLPEGATVLLQAGRSGLEEQFIPHSVPLELERVTPREGPIAVRGTLTVHVTKWRPIDIFGLEEEGRRHWTILPSPPTDAVGYTVSGGGTSAVTDARGNATLRLDRSGRFTLRASMPGSALDWSRTLVHSICVEETRRRC